MLESSWNICVNLGNFFDTIILLVQKHSPAKGQLLLTRVDFKNENLMRCLCQNVKSIRITSAALVQHK